MATTIATYMYNRAGENRHLPKTVAENLGWVAPADVFSLLTGTGAFAARLVLPQPYAFGATVFLSSSLALKGVNNAMSDLKKIEQQLTSKKTN